MTRNRPYKIGDFVFVRYGKEVEVVSSQEEPGLYQQIVELVGLGNGAVLPDNFQPNGFPAFLWPSTYEPKVVTQPFADNPQIYGQWGLPGHEGIDMRAPYGQEIIAVWDGKVSRVENNTAYGYSIRLRHEIEFPGGEKVEYETTYAHFLRMPEHRVGDKVVQGETVGLADSTGNSSGHHLHLSLKQFNHPELRPPMENEYPHNFIDPTPFFEWLEYTVLD
jgi:murein DD-endopeptidase MepM/ murein hydrolase activator NlpD